MNQILFAIGLDKIIIDQSFISDYLSELPFKYNTQPKCSICRTPGHDRRNCPEKKEIIDYIRKNLKNNDIYIELTVDEKIEEKLVYTEKDKYDLMKKKNPNLEKLRDYFNLSI